MDSSGGSMSRKLDTLERRAVLVGGGRRRTAGRPQLGLNSMPDCGGDAGGVGGVGATGAMSAVGEMPIAMPSSESHDDGGGGGEDGGGLYGGGGLHANGADPMQVSAPGAV